MMRDSKIHDKVISTTDEIINRIVQLDWDFLEGNCKLYDIKTKFYGRDQHQKLKTRDKNEDLIPCNANLTMKNLTHENDNLSLYKHSQLMGTNLINQTRRYKLCQI